MRITRSRAHLLKYYSKPQAIESTNSKQQTKNDSNSLSTVEGGVRATIEIGNGVRNEFILFYVFISQFFCSHSKAREFELKLANDNFSNSTNKTKLKDYDQTQLNKKKINKEAKNDDLQTISANSSSSSIGVSNAKNCVGNQKSKVIPYSFPSYTSLIILNPLTVVG